MNAAKAWWHKIVAASATQCMLLFVLAFASVSCSSSASESSGQGLPPVPLPPLSPARLKELLIANGSARSEQTLRRAMKESALYFGEYPVLAEAVLKGPAWSKGGHTRAIMRYSLERVRGQSVQVLVDFYHDAPADKRQQLRPVLGRIGRESRAAAPLLRAELQEADAFAKDKMAIKVVLACLGEATPAEMDEMTEAISTGREPGLAVVEAMVDCGFNPWVPEKMQKAIISLLGLPRLDPDDLRQGLRGGACLALATLGDKADAAVLKTLDAERMAASGDGQGPPLFKLRSGLCLAKAGPTRRRATMVLVLRESPGSLWVWQTRPFMEWLCSSIPEQDLLGVAGELLSERREAPLSAALVILYHVGPPARSAVPGLLAIVCSTDDDFRRRAAAEVLGMVADPSDLPLLDKLGTKVASQKGLKEALDESIKAIRLQD